MFSKSERTAVLIDGVNLHGTSRALGFDVDYRKLRDFFDARVHLAKMGYYTTLLEGADGSPVQPLIDWLDYNGYLVKTKMAREFTDTAGRRKIKGSIVGELSIDAVLMADRVDHLVLFSGDGEFRYLVETLQRTGLRVTVCSSILTQPSMVSDELRRQADTFLDLASLKQEIQREPT